MSECDIINGDYILAECHSDDRRVEIEFNARDWFAEASVGEIIELAEANWQYDHGSDVVAEFFRKTTTRPLFDYLDAITHPPAIGGFECSVDECDAIEWLREHRLDAFTAMKERGLIEQERL